jgi:hypothetical protein
MWSWGSRLAAVAFLMVLGAACGQALPVDGPESSTQRPVDAPLDNERYTILEMATAHGAFTIELEVDSDADTKTLARELVEPMRENYAEVLVYFYDRAGDGQLPIKRVQWTQAEGYVEVEF